MEASNECKLESSANNKNIAIAATNLFIYQMPTLSF